MRLLFLAFCLFSVFAVAVSADCIDLIDGMTINESAVLCSDMYDLPGGITIAGENLVFDCNTAILRGIRGSSEIGITVENSKNITLQNCNIVTFNQGLLLINVSHSLIEKNAFLKNRIGVRMFEAYENILRDNNDKSLQLPISAISSKFNVVMLGNRNVDRSFCEVNSCNKEVYMNPCEDGDYYCSVNCTSADDSDCNASVKVLEEFVPLDVEGAPKPTGRTVEQIEAEVKEKFASEKVDVRESSPEPVKRPVLPLNTKLFIYIAVYLVTLLTLHFVRKE